MVSKKFLFGLLAIALVFGMMAIGCEPEEIEKSVAINGIAATNDGKHSHIMVGKIYDKDNMDAGDFLGKNISGGSVNFELLDGSGRYTGDGQHYIVFVINYSDGYAYAPGVSSVTSAADLKTYNITEKNTSFSFNDFVEIPAAMFSQIFNGDF